MVSHLFVNAQLDQDFQRDNILDSKWWLAVTREENVRACMTSFMENKCTAKTSLRNLLEYERRQVGKICVSPLALLIQFSGSWDFSHEI